MKITLFFLVDVAGGNTITLRSEYASQNSAMRGRDSVIAGGNTITLRSEYASQNSKTT